MGRGGEATASAHEVRGDPRLFTARARWTCKTIDSMHASHTSPIASGSKQHTSKASGAPR